MDGHLKHSEAPLHPLLPSLVMLVESLLCAGTCFRSGLGGKLLGCRCPSDAPLLIRCSISLPDTSPRGSRSAQSDGRTRGMIYNPFQGIIAANGQSQCVLPKAGGGGQNQLMESLTWPGLMAECGLTSGSDKGPSEAELIRRLDKKEEKQPPPPINVMYDAQSLQSKQSSWTWASFHPSDPGGGGSTGRPPPSNIGIHYGAAR